MKRGRVLRRDDGLRDMLAELRKALEPEKTQWYAHRQLPHLLILMRPEGFGVTFDSTAYRVWCWTVDAETRHPRDQPENYTPLSGAEADTLLIKATAQWVRKKGGQPPSIGRYLLNMEKTLDAHVDYPWGEVWT